MAMQISRRNFVAGAATVGAMAAFGMAGCSSKGSGKAESKAEEYDIVIVGAGGAGMSAAIAAHDAGVEKVVVLEKEGNVGGNTNFSSSGMKLPKRNSRRLRASMIPMSFLPRKPWMAVTILAIRSSSTSCAIIPPELLIGLIAWASRLTTSR